MCKARENAGGEGVLMRGHSKGFKSSTWWLGGFQSGNIFKMHVAIWDEPSEQRAALEWSSL